MESSALRANRDPKELNEIQLNTFTIPKWLLPRSVNSVQILSIVQIDKKET